MVVIGKMISDQSCIVWSRGTGFGACYKYSKVHGFSTKSYIFLHIKKEHSVQTATRALKDGASEEVVVCGLFHDIGELLAPICHGEVGKSDFLKNVLLIEFQINEYFQLEVCCDRIYLPKIIGKPTTTYLL